MSEKINNIQKDIFDTSLNYSSDSYITKCRSMSDELVIEKISNLKDFRILDVGCSSGDFLNKVNSASELHGIDISQVSLNKISNRNIKVTACDLDVDNIPYDSEYFDVIYSSHVIEHVVNTHHFMEEIYRCLKKDGLFIIVCPNINQPISLLMQLIYDITPKHSARPYSAHVRDFSLRTLKRTILLHGFNISDNYSVGIYPFVNKLVQFLLRLFPRWGENLIIISKKGERKKVPEPIIDDVRDFLRK